MFNVRKALMMVLVSCAAMACVLAGGCSGKGVVPAAEDRPGGLDAVDGLPQDTPVSGAVQDGGMPAGLPDDPWVDPAMIEARRGSVLEDQMAQGSDVFLAGPGVACDPGDGSAGLEPEAASLAWAIYRFTDLLATDTGLQLTLTLDSPEPGSLYLGISDYSRSCWEWIEAAGFPADIDLDAAVGSTLINEGGCLYVAVACQAPETARVLGVRLSRDTLAPPPLGLTASCGTDPAAIALSWDDPAESYPELATEGIRVERRPAGGDWGDIAGLPAGAGSYIDTHGTGNGLDYGADYEYRISLVAGGTPGHPCPPVTGYRKLPDVTGFSASDSAYPDSIRLSWDRIAEADGYRIEIFHGDEWQPLTELDSGNYYFCRHYWDEFPGLELAFDTDYEYRIRAVWQEHHSEAWAGDTGRRGLAPAANITASDGSYPDRVEITWDPVAYATGYRVEYATDGVEAGLLVDLEGYAINAFSHTYLAPVGRECDLDKEYSYWVRPVYGDEIRPLDAENFDTGFRRVQPPQGTAATDGASSEHVLVTWEPPGEIVSFEVYRDGTDPGQLVATVDDTGEYTDIPPDYDEHTYYVVSVWQGQRSESGTPDTGYRNLFARSTVSEAHCVWVDLAMVDGRPAITASRDGEPGVWFHLADGTGPSGPEDWQDHQMLDCTAGSKSRIAVFAGRPAVLVAGPVMEYTNSITYSYSAVVAPAAATDWATHEIRDDASPLMDAVLCSVNGTPAMCYHDTTGYYYLSATADPPQDITDWESNRLRQHCYYPGLTDYNGVPVLVGSSLYALDRVLDLNVLIGQTATPASSGWDTHVRGEGCVSNAVAVVGGRLAGACRSGNSRISYSRALVDAPAGEADWSNHEIDGCRAIRGSGFLAECGGYPAVAYTSSSDTGVDLMVAIGTTATPDGPADWAIRRVDPAAEITHWAIAEIDGKAAVAYLRANDGETPHLCYAAAAE